MKWKNEEGFSLMESLAAIAILAMITIPVCSSLVLSARLNGQAEKVLQARIAVSSTVERLMAEGMDTHSDHFDDDVYLPASDERVTVKLDPAGQTGGEGYYNIIVSDAEGLVSINTCIRAVLPQTEGGGT